MPSSKHRGPCARPHQKLAPGGGSGPEELEAAVENEVEAVVRAAAERAAERRRSHWRDESPAGPSWRTAAGSTARPERLGEQTQREVRAWQGFVFDLVRSEGA